MAQQAADVDLFINATSTSLDASLARAGLTHDALRGKLTAFGVESVLHVFEALTPIPLPQFWKPPRIELQFAYLHEVTLNSAKTQLLIGGDFLAQFIFQFDYPNQRMRWLTRATLDLHALSNVPSRTDKQSTGVLAKVLLNDRQALWVTVDTGAKSGLWIESTTPVPEYSSSDKFMGQPTLTK